MTKSVSNTYFRRLSIGKGMSLHHSYTLSLLKDIPGRLANLFDRIHETEDWNESIDHTPRIGRCCRMKSTLDRIKGGLIVSCQALEDEPLYGSVHMAAMARAALMSGAAGIRANSVEDISAIRAITDKPIVGINKHRDRDGQVFITPDFADAKAVVEAGATIVALDCTYYHHPEDKELETLIRQIKERLGVPVMADCSSYEEMIRAAKLGADITAPTLVPGPRPDYDLLQQAIENTDALVIGEGHYWHPKEVVRALQMGAHAVVVGSAITRPQLITARFTEAIQKAKEKS